MASFLDCRTVSVLTPGIPLRRVRSNGSASHVRYGPVMVSPPVEAKVYAASYPGDSVVSYPSK